MYVVGLVSAAGVDTYYRLDSTGMPHAMAVGDNSNKQGTFPGSDALPKDAVAALAQSYPSGWADYSIAVSLTEPVSIDLSQINPANCPGLGTGTAAFSGRVYISVGVPRLPFTALANGYTAPVTSGGPGEFTLFDWIEFSFDSAGAFNGNTTQVDQFGFELLLNGTPGGTLQGQLNQTRSAVINAFSNLPDPFTNLLQVQAPAAAAAAYPPGISFLRVISPKTITAPPTFTGNMKTYFDDVIKSSYWRWKDAPLVTFDQGTGFFTGLAIPQAGSSLGILTFFQGEFPTLQELNPQTRPVAFQLTGADPATNVILTSDIWQCVNTLASGSDAQKNVGKMLAAAFNHGVVADRLDDANCENNAASFYPAGGTWNLWARMFHEFSANKLAYGFPYDDVCNQNPSISLTGTQSVTITLGKFNS